MGGQSSVGRRSYTGVVPYILVICSWKTRRRSTRRLFSVGVRRPLATLNISGCKYRAFTWRRQRDKGTDMEREGERRGERGTDQRET